MAKFFPDKKSISQLLQKPTSGELHVLYVLEGLSDDYEVYFQPFINGYNPDIIIVRENYGALIIEVKDWELVHYKIDSEDNWILIKDNIPIKSPIKQVEAYKNNLYNLSIPALLHGKIKDKKYYGIVQTAVYFHKESSSYLNKCLKSNDFCPIFGNDNFSIDKIINHKCLLRKYPNKLFNNEIYSEFKRILKPSFHILEQSQKVILSKKQKQLSRSEIKHQKIRGVAGSGKTLVLSQRAVNSHLRHGKKVLILTFNITLRNYIHDNLNRVRKEFHWKYFHIIHYHAFILTEATNHNLKNVNFDNINLFENVKSEITKYDAIFIDEIQDYQEEWIRIIKKYFLVEQGELVVFGDEKQNIYDKKLDSNRKPNTTIKGAWTRLDQSFRLSDKILELAEDFQKVFFADKYELDKAIPKQLSLDFQQGSIEYHKYNDTDTIEDLSIFLINKFKENLIQPQDICILAQSNILLRNLDFKIRELTNQRTYTTFETQEMYLFLKERKNNEIDLDEELRLIRRNKRFNFWMNSGGIKLSTVHSFKGWEINTLFLIIDSKSEYETHEIIYTALTRCRNRLFIININNNVYDNFFSNKIDSKDKISNNRHQLKCIITDNKNQQTLRQLIEEDVLSENHNSAQFR